jgi:putative transposase
VPIVARVTRQVQVSAGGVFDPVLDGRVAARCEELIRAKAAERGWRIVALEIMPDHVHLFVKAHRSDCPFRVASQFKAFISRRLRAEFPHLRPRLPALWSRSYFAATAGAVCAETVRRYIGTQNERPWRKERRFKPRSRFTQTGFVAGDGTKWTPADAGGWARATFQAVGSVKVRQHRAAPGTVKFLQLKREHRRWYVIVITEAGAAPLPAAGRAVGVDVGVARFLTTSDGEIAANPKFLAAAAEAIAGLQRRKEQARRGSGNRKRIRRPLAREWRKARNRRRDFHHKTARTLVSTCDVIALEKLSTGGMTRRPAPKPDPD